ncbi:MAG: molybdopterin oxidoreductase family protein [Actinobacteria bacterium]|nr:molybdopterin oxidoreductase family protein [Actinomycetota bacterium]
MAATRIAYRTCPLCEATCGLEIHLDGDDITLIRGDKDDVFSRGFVCPKGTALKALEADPDRLRRPLVRQGDTWHEVSWDDAFAEVERGLQAVFDAHGRDAVAVYMGNPNAHNLAGMVYNRVLNQGVGTTNVFSASTVDQMPKHVSAGLMFGSPISVPLADIDRTDYLLILGANPFASNGSLMTAPDMPGRLRALRARGGRFVVVDPRRTKTAEEADEHVPIRPGTDAHFLLALVNVLVDEGLVHLGHAEGLVNGYDEVVRLADGFTPDAVAPVTGVPAETTRRIARDLAGTERAAVYGRIGTCTQEFGSLASWLVDVVNVLAGNLDRDGGAMFARPAIGGATAEDTGKGRGFRLGRRTSRVRGLPEALGELPVATLADEIETPGDGQVHALICLSGNPVCSTPDAGRLDRVLAGLDFMVALDIYRNETTRHANVILPAPRVLAKSHYDMALYNLAIRTVANYSPPAVELGPDEIPEWEIMCRLAAIVAGQGSSHEAGVAVDDFVLSTLVSGAVGRKGGVVEGRDAAELVAELSRNGRRGPERVLDLMLRTGPYGDGFGAPGHEDGLSLAVLEANPHGVDLGPLQPRLPGVLRTPSGRIELAPPELVADAEARLVPTLARPVDGLRLIGRRDLRSNNSWMHNLEVLVKGKARCTLLVHPDDAARLGLADGDPARVRSAAGEVQAPVEVTDTMMPGVVSLPHGWGHDADGAAMETAAAHAGVNSNVLTDGSVLDALSGNAILNGIPVEVEALVPATA